MHPYCDAHLTGALKEYFEVNPESPAPMRYSGDPCANCSEPGCNSIGVYLVELPDIEQ